MRYFVNPGVWELPSNPLCRQLLMGFESLPPRGCRKSHPWSELTTAVIPAKAGIHFDFSPAGRPRPCCRATSGCGIERIRFSFLCSVLFLPAREQRRPNEEEKRQRRKWIPAFAGMTAKTENRAQAQVLLPPRWGFSTTPCQGGKGHVPDEGGIPSIELFIVGTGLRACPDEGQPRRAGQARRPVPTKPSYPQCFRGFFVFGPLLRG